MTVFPSSTSGIKLKTLLRFPYRVTAGSGVQAPISGGTITFGLNYAPLTSAAPISTPSNFTVALLDETTGEYKTATLDQLPTTTTGDVRTARGDANYAILADDRYVALTASLTAARAWSLPAASTVTGGIRIAVYDEAGGITSTNTLTIGVTGSDTIDGASTFVLNNAYAGAEFRSDGISKWTVALVGTVGLADASITTGKVAANAITNAKLAQMATLTLKANVTGGTADPADITAAQLRDSLLPNGSVIDFATDTYAANTDLTTVIPADDTIPQVTEGTQILTATITPKTTTNRVRVQFTGSISASANSYVAAAVFVNGATDAVYATFTTVQGNNLATTIALDYSYVPASTSAQVITIRVGPQAGTARMNGTNSARFFGGRSTARLTVTEIKA